MSQIYVVILHYQAHTKLKISFTYVGQQKTEISITKTGLFIVQEKK